MSASDAAPLPRLGEVFFDVRGESRSMRLSWYADTGVAVFSIWQGGMCTGTFRLPMDDLARMIEILRRGPQSRSGRRQPAVGDRRQDADRAPGYGGSDPDATQFSLDAMPDQLPYEVPPARRRHSGGYESGGYEQGGYEQGGYESGGGYNRPAARHGSPSADYPAAGYQERDSHSGAYRVGDGAYGDGAYGDGAYQPDATGQQSLAGVGAAGYGQDRFVPPYVQPAGQAYPNDNEPGEPDRGGYYGHGAYPDDRQLPPAGPDYPDQGRPAGGYFDRPDYLLTADRAPVPRHSAGRHASQPAGSLDPAQGGETSDLPGPEPDYRGQPRR